MRSFLARSIDSKEIIRAYRQKLSEIVLAHYKFLMPFMFVVFALFSFTDMYMRHMPALTYARIPTILLNALLIVVVYTALRTRTRLVLILNDLYAVSLIFMGMGIIAVAYYAPVYNSSLAAFVLLSVASHFFVKGFKSIAFVYTLPVVVTLYILFTTDYFRGSRFPDLLNLFVIYMGVVAVSILSERSRIKEFYLKESLNKEKAFVENLYQETQSKNKELFRLNKKLDETLNELSMADTMKNKLFSLIAHDLRYPFTTLIGYSKLLVEHGSEFSKQDMEIFHEQMLVTSEKTYNLLQNLLHWSMTQTGTLKLHPDKYTMNKLMSEIIDETNSVISKKNIHLDFSYTSDYDLIIDKEAFMIVMRNILSNAIKFSYENSVVQIIVQLMDNSMNIKVIDSGIGMNTEKMEQINRLVMLETTPGTQNEKGIGIGLVLVKEIVAKLEGTIRFISVQGKGTTVEVLLPVLIYSYSD